jgi:glycosyltransferase involved in cell wall biosynthesis
LPLDRKLNKGKEYDIIYFPLGAAAFGGAERSLLDLSEEIAKRGRKVLIVAEMALRGTSFPAEAARRGIDLEWVKWSPDRSLWLNLRSAAGFLRACNGAILHFNISWRRYMWMLPLLARLLTRSRVIGSMRAMPDPHQLIPRRWYFGFIPGLRLWHLPETVVGRVWARTLHVTVSVNARDFPPRLIAHYGFSPDRLKVIYNGIQTSSTILNSSLKKKTRDELAVFEDDLLICFVGRLSPEKGVMHLLKALADLPPKFKLVLVGDGPQRPALEAFAAEARIKNRVKFLGSWDNPEDIMSSSDIVVVPSTWYEAFGRVVIEAMNHGVAVIASRIGGMAELFDDGVEGVYVQPADPSELALALRTMEQDRQRLRAMGASGRALVGQRYSITRVVQQYADLYEELLTQ